MMQPTDIETVFAELADILYTVFLFSPELLNVSVLNAEKQLPQYVFCCLLDVHSRDSQQEHYDHTPTRSMGNIGASESQCFQAASVDESF